MGVEIGAGYEADRENLRLKLRVFDREPENFNLRLDFTVLDRHMCFVCGSSIRGEGYRLNIEVDPKTTRKIFSHVSCYDDFIEKD